MGRSDWLKLLGDWQPFTQIALLNSVKEKQITFMHIFIIVNNKEFFVADFLDLISNSGALVFKTKG